MSTCTSCSGPLDVAAVLCDSTRCTTCEAKRIRLAADPWACFLRILRANVKDDNTVHVNDVRELMRGRIEPKSIARFYRQAKSVGVLAGGNEWEPSTDEQGGNDDKQARIWRAGPSMWEAAA